MKFWSPLFRAWWTPGGNTPPPPTGHGWVTKLALPANWVVPETVVPTTTTQ